jgi:hypothetical protein
MKHCFFQILVFIFMATTTLLASGSQPIACGKEWINIHQKNPDLIGVYVQQVPDNKADAAVYRGKHPAMIIYVFKNGKAHQVSYTPTGQIENGFWWDIPPNDWIYSHLDTNLREGIRCGYWVKNGQQPPNPSFKGDALKRAP